MASPIHEPFDAPAPSLAGPRWLYVHGFASGPASTKGLALEAHYARAGITLERLDARVPSLEHLRLSAIVETIQRAIGLPSDRAIVFGSSLGGLAACRAAERDPRICALVLLAPAFRAAERWRTRMSDAEWNTWKTSGWLAIDDHAEKRRARVDFEFIVDAARVDEPGSGWPDVRVPTLIVHGRRDETVDITLSQRWADKKRHVRLVTVDDGHELVASLPGIAQEADAFLAPFLLPSREG